MLSVLLYSGFSLRLKPVQVVADILFAVAFVIFLACAVNELKILLKKKNSYDNI